MSPSVQRSLVHRVADRVLDRPATSRRSVLLVDDQRRGALPQVCVKSGRSTDGAVTARAVGSPHAAGWTIVLGQAATGVVFGLLRRPVLTVTLPVTDDAYRTWRSRLSIAIVVTSIGAGLGIVGAVRSIPGLIFVGTLLFVLGWLNRVRAWHNAWVGLELRQAAGEVVVTRTHSSFDREAAAMFSRAKLRRSR